MNVDNWGDRILLVLGVVLLSYFFYGTFNGCLHPSKKVENKKIQTPRDKDSDCLYSDDSIYYIHYTIDSVESIPNYD